jgi:membrane protein required for colicin V production
VTLVDWIITAILVLATLAGFAQGFFRSLFGLGGLVVGLIAAAWNYPRVARWLMPMIGNQQAADLVAFLLVALLVMVFAGVLGIVISKALHSIGLGCLDRLAGAVFGLFQGTLLVTLGILVTVAFFPSTQWLRHSKLSPHFYAFCRWSTHASPEELARRVRLELKTLENESPAWMHPGKSGA